MSPDNNTCILHGFFERFVLKLVVRLYSFENVTTVKVFSPKSAVV